MKQFRMVMMFAAVSAAILCCNQKINEGDDLLTEGAQSILVEYLSAPKHPTQEVFFDNLETQYKFNNQPVVSLEDIITGAGLVLTTKNLWLNFIGVDNYTPLENDNCVTEYLPTPGTMANQGYIVRGTRLLLFDEALQVPSCMAVKDVAKIQIAEDPAEFVPDTDADTDTNTTSDTDTNTNAIPTSINVTYLDQTVPVDLAGIAASTLDTTEVRLVSAIIQASGLKVNLANVELSFEGTDGYNPTEEGTCTENLPSPGSTAEKAGIELANGDLYWESSMGYAGCAFVREAAAIYITDAQ